MGMDAESSSSFRELQGFTIGFKHPPTCTLRERERGAASSKHAKLVYSLSSQLAGDLEESFCQSSSGTDCPQVSGPYRRLFGKDAAYSVPQVTYQRLRPRVNWTSRDQVETFSCVEQLY